MSVAQDPFSLGHLFLKGFLNNVEPCLVVLMADHDWNKPWYHALDLRYWRVQMESLTVSHRVQKTANKRLLHAPWHHEAQLIWILRKSYESLQKHRHSTLMFPSSWLHLVYIASLPIGRTRFQYGAESCLSICFWMRCWISKVDPEVQSQNWAEIKWSHRQR